MTGHVRKRGDRWEALLELGDEPAQVCPRASTAAAASAARPTKAS